MTSLIFKLCSISQSWKVRETKDKRYRSQAFFPTPGCRHLRTGGCSSRPLLPPRCRGRAGVRRPSTPCRDAATDLTSRSNQTIKTMSKNGQPAIDKTLKIAESDWSRSVTDVTFTLPINFVVCCKSSAEYCWELCRNFPLKCWLEASKVLCFCLSKYDLAGIFVVSTGWLFTRLNFFTQMNFLKWNFRTNFQPAEKHVFNPVDWIHLVEIHMCGHTYESYFQLVEN